MQAGFVFAIWCLGFMGGTALGQFVINAYKKSRQKDGRVYAIYLAAAVAGLLLLVTVGGSLA